jgi:hypothetical protein
MKSHAEPVSVRVNDGTVCKYFRLYQDTISTKQQLTREQAPKRCRLFESILRRHLTLRLFHALNVKKSIATLKASTLSK